MIFQFVKAIYFYFFTCQGIKWHRSRNSFSPGDLIAVLDPGRSPIGKPIGMSNSISSSKLNISISVLKNLYENRRPSQRRLTPSRDHFESKNIFCGINI